MSTESPCWLCEGGVDEFGRFTHDNACASQARPNRSELTQAARALASGLFKNLALKEEEIA
ncbi:hypothetical protein SPF06_00870 [Sinomonas sp. JGH33]|uniref:Uncharacterized protein n=1 Tax=Sinomonas terricola TaxID=3110330 RepID=A0ABU5T0T3_9MICC|nr:hypothetical protein [Sinomonas sp. JGH33]MEA5453262.1 hypothetical protein [Sinomonas sp. JGH33]